jgi:hypothetical protein
MQKPLREGFQIFRQSWREDTYVMVEDGITVIFWSGGNPSGQEYRPNSDDLAADDWAATGLSGE